MKNRDKQMNIEIKDGQFIISVGVDLTCSAVYYGIENNVSSELEITDNDTFAEDILRELKAEEEDGTNLIHRAFDKAAILSIENGGEGTREKANHE